ncbi:uncharacterized protein LOC132561440 [Ylistrum balloti]|uniref:uncharacterized protein LOC132561440 n=1 Tax=Ylistrum balloti TaxID=509963 RepID=UPI0029058D0B|nr:uncharacterized protein LOC132561440 [Ylistrum balloti]
MTRIRPAGSRPSRFDKFVGERQQSSVKEEDLDELDSVSDNDRENISRGLRDTSSSTEMATSNLVPSAARASGGLPKRAFTQRQAADSAKRQASTSGSRDVPIHGPVTMVHADHSYNQLEFATVLLRLTRSPFSPMGEASLKWLTLKTLFLLVVASAARASELHALSVEQDHIRWEQAGDGNQKEASKDSIARWIVSVVKFWYESANEEGVRLARAHDTRRLATSRALFSKVPISEIVKAAHWAKETTFTSFYLKDIWKPEGQFARTVILHNNSYLPGTGDTMNDSDTSMDFIDVDVLKKSVRMFVTGPRKHSVTRFEIVKCLLASGLPGEEIVSVFRCEAPNTWFVTLRSEVHVDRVVEKGPMKETYFSLVPERCDQRRLSIRVQWLPSWISDDAIAEHFDGHYGKVVHVSRETTTIGEVRLETGTRVLTLVIREGDQDLIPYRSRMFGKVALIIVPGRPPICLRCQQVGHVRSQCPGRPEQTTRMSYAAKVSQSTAAVPEMTLPSAAADSPPAPEEVVSTEPPQRPTQDTASPSSGGSSVNNAQSTKRSGPEVDEEGFQKASKKGRHSAFSPMVLSNGDLVPGQKLPESTMDYLEDNQSEESEGELVIDEGHPGS